MTIKCCEIIKYFRLLLFVFLTITSIKVFIVDIYFVPSSSMEDTIISGDVVIGVKYYYGAIIPNSLRKIPFIGIFFKEVDPLTMTKEIRLPSIGQVKRGDICVFDIRGRKFVKRVIASKGDTITIVNGQVKINSVPEEILDDYKLTFEANCTPKLIDSLRRWYNLDLNANTIHMRGKLFRDINEKIKERLIAFKNPQDSLMNLTTLVEKWDRNNFGEYTVPSKGFKIILDSMTIGRYYETMIQHEQVTIYHHGNMYFINGVASQTYVFKNDYYFLMGDNRMNSIDSRFFGVIPYSKIIAKVILH